MCIQYNSSSHATCPHKDDEAGAKIAIWGSDSLVGPWSRNSHLATCTPSDRHCQSTLAYQKSLLGGQHRIIRHQIANCGVSPGASSWSQDCGHVFGQGCESRPWVFGMRRSLCRPSLVLTLTDPEHHQRLLVHGYPRPGTANPSTRETTFTNRGPHHRSANLPVM